MLKRILQLIFGKRPSESPIKEIEKQPQVLNQDGEVKKDQEPKKSQPHRVGTRRLMDMSAEGQLASFLDEYFYERLLEEGNFISITRIIEKDEQLKGIDVRMETQSAKAYVDEKAQLYYINSGLPTFAFELQFLKGNQVIEGWFLNDGLQTTHYLLMWPYAKTKDLKVIKKDDFTKIEALIISKSKLRKTLAHLGLDKKELNQGAYTLRKNRSVGKTSTSVPGIYYYASNPSNYVEAPINIVISKKYLIEWSDQHYEISKDGFSRLK